MRKRTISNIADHVFWLLIALLPLVIYGFTCLSYELTSASDTLPSLMDFLVDFGISDTSITYTVLDDIFGSTGILPLFNPGSVVLLFLSYFTTVEIVHLAVDFLLFIPRLSHKWMEKITCTE